MYIVSSNIVSGYPPMQTFYKAIKATEKDSKSTHTGNDYSEISPTKDDKVWSTHKVLVPHHKAHDKQWRGWVNMSH